MKQIFSIFAFFAFIGGIYPQAPQGINFQGVARNADTSPKPAGTTVNVEFKIWDAAQFGNLLYYEKQSPQTNGVGIFTCVIGTGTVQPGSGAFANIAWAVGQKYLEVLVDGQASGARQLMASVPYALYAAKTNETQTLSINPNNNQLSISGGNTVTLPTPTVYVPEIYVFEEQYAHGLVPTTASGQPPVGGTFNTRNLNIQVFPTSGGAGNVTIGGSLLTFKPGTYLIDASAPAFFTGRHQLFLRRSDNNVIQLTGTCETNATNDNNVSNGTGIDQNRSFIKGIMVVPPGSDRVVKLDHYFDVVILPGSTPLGVEFSQTATFWNSIQEVYATITIQKIQ